ncbi:MAG: anti-sigma factor [Candidatus Sulfotelmatobacter sp.]
MTCVELQTSLAENESASSPEQRAHLKNCAECSALVADLLVIACAAGELRAAQEPSPRVWNGIEAALRREGLIRPQRAKGSLLPAFSGSWGWARWMLPVAAALLVTVGVLIRQHSASHEIARNENPSQSARSVAGLDLSAGLNDADLMQEVEQQPAALKAEYSDSLRRANQYIEDAKNVVAADPNDEEARRSLMEAYQQKAMLFEFALDRSLP